MNELKECRVCTRGREEQVKHQGIVPVGVDVEVAGVGVCRAVEDKVGNRLRCLPTVWAGRRLCLAYDPKVSLQRNMSCNQTVEQYGVAARQTRHPVQGSLRFHPAVPGTFCLAPAAESSQVHAASAS